MPRESEQRKVSSGVDAMRAAADLVLRKHCMKIAEKLASSSMEGHIQSARFLFVLADENQKPSATETVERSHTLASELEAEPPWRGKSSEETAVAAGGSREQEVL